LTTRCLRTSRGITIVQNFGVFQPPHGFPCFRWLTRISVFSPTHTAFRVTRISVFSCLQRLPADTRNFVFSGNTRNSIPHGISCFRRHTVLRIFVFSPFHDIPTSCLTCGPSDDLVHAPLFALCVTSTLLVGIYPSQLPCCRGTGAFSTSFSSAWALVDSASLNHTSIHRLSPNDFRSPSRRHYPIDYHSRRFCPD
jgi:hypothetical protein